MFCQIPLLQMVLRWMLAIRGSGEWQAVAIIGNVHFSRSGVEYQFALSRSSSPTEVLKWKKSLNKCVIM